MLGKEVSADAAVSVIRDGDAICISGFVGVGTPDELILALERRFLATGHPRDLTLVFAAAPGDGRDRGLNRLAHNGLVRRGIGGHWSLVPKLATMAMEDRIEAYNLPLGVVSQLYREIAGAKPGMLSKVAASAPSSTRASRAAASTSAPPRTSSASSRSTARNGSSTVPSRSTSPSCVPPPPDPRGNATMEREALKLDATSAAMAAHNSDGVVIVQVERMAVAGSLAPKRVLIPGALVDCVVVSDPENHRQTYATPYNHAFSGELRVPLDARPPLPLDARKVIARRAAMELLLGGVVNLGIGMPEGVAAVAAEEGLLDHVTLTAEPGVIGGMPQGGLDFGAALNPDAILQQSLQFDFYDGGGLDMACLGMAETDRLGNVNVSKFGPRFAGAGGFINISQNASRLVLAGTFTAGGLEVAVEDGQLRIVAEGRTAKFVETVEQITFSGERAAAIGQPVLYVTERAVFTASPKGLQLIEIAPGVDLGRDILAHMEFTPVIDGPVTMDPRLFRSEPMGLKAQFLDAPIEARITFDDERNLLIVNLRGYRVRTRADLDAIADRCEALVAPLGRKVDMVAWYDGFTLDPALDQAYADMVAGMEKRFYRSSVRYTRDPFTRLRFGAELAKRDLSMRLHRDAILTGAS